MRVTYFASDLVDAASVRRVRVLRQGGADVTLVGFRRSANPVVEVEGVPAIDLGQTYSGRLGHRCAQVVHYSLGARTWKDIIANSDVLLARNLEMVTIADAARVWARSTVPLVYECLDIHATQLGNSVPSKLLRSWERRILSRSAKLVVSSQAFVTNYFDLLNINLPEIILAENKRVISEDEVSRPSCTLDDRQPPWRIGWFGLLRCAESFQLLLNLAERYPVDITLRGRPVPSFQDLIDEHLPLNNMRFCGPYTQADLAAIYEPCDFVWAIEYAGQNAQNPNWALGNRIYEGGYYNVPVIARTDTAMGAWLREHKTGVVLDYPRTELASLFANLTTADYRALQRSSANVPTDDLAWTTESCRHFADRLMGGFHDTA